ncbi:CD44 antigen isoform X3 [Sphaerodactylus townsendi]|uniref:CD44 antigen isoform X3 n=1 Tax=Sphaerodactylus townsendi TaxID=933632 RepID=UPI00202731CE|nr:CD44 antigen isoform X3 [Sphaerodactylus townsendi]
MAKFWLCAAVGLYLLQLCLAQISLNISCRYAGVFHVEKNRRYSLRWHKGRKEGSVELCKALNSTLPTWEQMEKAFELGLETCRYGYIEEKIVVPRHTPYHLCAANTTGIYVLQSNISERYDTYCFNSSETRDKVCDPVTELYSSWPDNQSIIEIFNSDGTRYIGGRPYTDPPPVTDDDSSMGSGSANDRGTTDPNVLRPDVFQTSFDEDATHFSYGVHPKDDGILQSPDDPEDHDSKPGYEGPRPKNTSKGCGGNFHGKLNMVTTDLILQDGNAEEFSTPPILRQKTAPGWDTNEIEELYTATTMGDIRYSANDTRDDTLPGIVPPGDGEHYSTALSSSNSFFKQQVSTPYQPDGAHSGLEAEVAFPTNLTSDDLHLELGSSEEKDNSLEEEAFHAAAVFINGSAKDEESHHDQLLPVGKPGGRRGKSSSTNTTGHGVVQILIPPSESDNENEAAETVVVSTDGTSHEDSDHDHLVWDNENTIPAVIFLNESKNEKDLETDHTAVLSRDNTSSEDSTRDIILHREHSGWDSEDKYPTNASRDHLMPESIPSVKREHENESTHTVAISNDGTMHEVSIQDSLNHEADPGRDSGERHQANDSTNNVLPGNIFPNEHIHEKETFDTVVDSTDERNHDDVTDHPAWHVVQHEWDGYPTNSTKDEEGFAISPPPENNNEEKVFHTAVIHNNDAHNEDATQEPLLPVHQPGWDMEEEYSTNTSRDDILMGVIANSGSKHDPFPTDVVSHDVTKDEDSTPEPVKHVSEDKYSTNSTEGVLPPRIVPRRGSNHINNTYHTGFDSRGSQQEDSTPKSQPRAAHIPDWLIVVASLIALALILGVCIAVNSRRRCGQKQKLVINNGKGVVDNKNMGGLNGEASKSHEMVHLVHKEQPEELTGPHDEFLQVDETNNLQDVDLKSESALPPQYTIRTSLNI